MLTFFYQFRPFRQADHWLPSRILFCPFQPPPPPPPLLLSLFNGPFFRISALLSTERLQTHACTTITKIFD